MQELVELVGADAEHHLFIADEALVGHVKRHVQCSHTSTLANTALQHIQLTVLDGELNVQHILVVLLQDFSNLTQLSIDTRHQLLQRRHISVLVVLGLLIQRTGGANTGHDILALSVDQPLAIELVLASGRVAGEGHTGGAIVAHVAEDHGLHVDGGTPIVGNTLNGTIADSLLTVPRFEHSLDSTFHLGLGIVGEFGAQHLFHLHLEIFRQLFQIFGGQIGVALIAMAGLVFVKHVVQLLADAFAVGRVDALTLFHHHVGIHHNQSAVGIINKTRIVGTFQHTGDGLRRKTYIEDRVHHTRHRGAGTRTTAHQQRVLRVVIFHAHQFLYIGHTFPHFVHQPSGKFTMILVICGAAFCRDRQASRHRKTKQAHLGQVGALTAKEVFHVSPALGSSATKSVNVFSHNR